MCSEGESQLPSLSLARIVSGSDPGSVQITLCPGSGSVDPLIV